MSKKEADRIGVLSRLKAKQLKQIEAAKLLGVGARQVRRLEKRFGLSGAQGLIHQSRGKTSNNRLSESTKQEIIHLLKSRYVDFGPTFACEKLVEEHQIKVSAESLRKLMIEADLWKGKVRKVMTVHQMRERRACFGELIQMDGSFHDWFEGRAPNCCLIVLIDDATSQVVGLRFAPVESTKAYFDALETYLQTHGAPISLYTDKHSIFRVNIPEAQTGTGDTQLSRALKQLNIELMCANTPQAKGRVERVNKTLQDRLVKELRLKGISTIEAANAYVAEYLKKHNSRFAVSPRSDVDAHKINFPNQINLEQILSHQTIRTLSKNLELSYNNVIYQIQLKTPGYGMRGAKITVVERHGQVTLLYKGNSLNYKTFDKANRPTAISTAKEVELPTKVFRPPPGKDHPWNKYPSGFSKKTLKQNIWNHRSTYAQGPQGCPA